MSCCKKDFEKKLSANSGQNGPITIKFSNITKRKKRGMQVDIQMWAAAINPLLEYFFLLYRFNKVFIQFFLMICFFFRENYIFCEIIYLYV